MGADQITLQAGTYTLTRDGSGEDGNLTGDLDIDGDLTINGAGPESTIIDATGLGDRVMNVAYSNPGHTVNLNNLTLTGGSFLAATPGVELRTRFGGLKSLFSGEGAFLLDVSGQGELFFNTYGALVERDVDGELVVDEVEVPVLVPQTALQSIEGRTVVFVREGEAFEPRPVTVGRANELQVEITSGLAAKSVLRAAPLGLPVVPEV